MHEDQTITSNVNGTAPLSLLMSKYVPVAARFADGQWGYLIPMASRDSTNWQLGMFDLNFSKMANTTAKVRIYYIEPDSV